MLTYTIAQMGLENTTSSKNSQGQQQQKPQILLDSTVMRYLEYSNLQTENRMMVSRKGGKGKLRLSV